MTTSLKASCCIAGGGPAGMMLGFLLARMGVSVIVLEKHSDFLRDFRGDTIHPSTLELMYELGLLEDFLKLPHQELTELSAKIGNEMVKMGDFSHLPTHCKKLVLMPQWDFLNFLVEQGRRYSGFQVMMQAEVNGLIKEGERIVGVRAKTPSGPVEIFATLTVGADGRHSTVREQAGLRVIDIGAPMDALWMRISRRSGDPGQTLGHAEPGKILIKLNRGDYWQCGYVIAKGEFENIRRRGIERFREELASLEPFWRDRVDELRGWNDVSLLTVKVDRLERWWRPGLLCIGDAAHAMSPVGGVGINLAIQDAVAASNILGPQLAAGKLTDADLEKVEQRREFPTRATQKLQVLVQNRVIGRVLTSQEPLSVPWIIRLMQHFSMLRRIPARVVGIGFRPEHVQTRESAVTANVEQPRQKVV
jgi:2-polyprenyl-6-methoxyphenol hydroxylase-like FAD-dependent oxidoreductase